MVRLIDWFSLNLQTIPQLANSFKRKTNNKVTLQDDTKSIGVLKGGIIGQLKKDKGSYRKRDILGKLQLRDNAGTSFPPRVWFTFKYKCVQTETQIVFLTSLQMSFIICLCLSSCLGVVEMQRDARELTKDGWQTLRCKHSFEIISCTCFLEVNLLSIKSWTSSQGE